MKVVAALFGTMAILLSSAAKAEIVLRPALACKETTLLAAVNEALANNNIDAVRQMLSSGDCVALDAGEAVSVVDAGIMTATIRYRGMTLFVGTAAIR